MEIYFDPEGGVYNDNSVPLSIYDLVCIFDKMGLKIDKRIELRKYYKINGDFDSVTEEVGECEVIRIGKE